MHHLGRDVKTTYPAFSRSLKAMRTKHICWYLEGRKNAEPVRQELMRAKSADRQFRLLAGYFNAQDDSREAA